MKIRLKNSILMDVRAQLPDDTFNTFHCDSYEIIEEDKKIDKLSPISNDYSIVNKINVLVDAVNKLMEK